MKKEITDIITNEDYRKIKSMVMHKYNKTKLHPDIEIKDGGYVINGISHISKDNLLKMELKCSTELLKEIINTEWNRDKQPLGYRREKIISVQQIDSSDDVYDIAMNGTNHYFFADNILVHNTDSVYFSVAEYAKNQGVPFDLTKEEVVDLYYDIGEQVGKTFPEFMDKTFNTGIEKGKIVGADLEMVGSRGLFLKKKRYAILKYWEDGFRLDEKDGLGKIKAMGLEIKRSDTAKYIQDFLEETLIGLLAGENEKQLRERVFTFKREFKDKPSVEKGSPRTVKNLTNLTEVYNKTGSCHVGHVLAAIQWNRLRELNDDKTVPEATDGTKVMVCKLLPNPLGIKSIGYPIDCSEYLPDWFTSLPFDDDEMEKGVLTKKLDNIFGILDMDIGINVKSTNTAANDLFDWGDDE